MQLRNKLAAAAALALASASSFATVDVTEITGTKTDIAAVGAAVLGVFIAIKLYKWVRRAL